MELQLLHHLRHAMWARASTDSPPRMHFLTEEAQFRLAWNGNWRDSTSGNASNSSSLNVSVSSAVAVAVSDWLLRYSAIYLVPLLILLGVLNNVLVLCVMPRAMVTVPTRVKRLYVGIAFGDLLTTITKNLVYFYFEDGLYYTTGGGFWVCCRKTSPTIQLI